MIILHLQYCAPQKMKNTANVTKEKCLERSPLPHNRSRLSSRLFLVGKKGKRRAWRDCKDMVTYFDIFDFFVSKFDIFVDFCIHIFHFLVFFSSSVQPVLHSVLVRNSDFFLKNSFTTDRLRFFSPAFFFAFCPASLLS